MDDGTVAAGDFSLSSGSVDSVSHPAGTDDKSATLSVSGLASGDTSVTPDVTLTKDSVDDTGGDTGPSSDTTVTASDGATPVQETVAYRDTDSDGTVDRIDITYSEDVSASSPESGDYSLSGGDSGSVEKDGTASVSGSTVQLDVTGPTDDTDLALDLDYSKGSGTADSITDGSNPAASFSGVSVTDAAAPTFDSVTTNDTDADGKVDRLSIAFTEGVASGSVEDADFSIKSANGLSGSLGTASDDDGDDTVNFTVSESSADTDATPTVEYSQTGGSSNKLQDSAGNLMADTTSAAATDGAPPVAVSGLYKDTDSDGTVDRVEMTFSEPVSYGTYNDGDWTVTANDLSGLSLSGKQSVIGSTSMVKLTASADANVTGVGTGTQPTVAYEPSGSGSVTGDSAGLEAVANGTGAQSLNDSATPAISGAATNTSSLDKVDVTFSEGVWTDKSKSGSLGSGDFSFTDGSGGGVGVSSVRHTGGSSSATVTLDGDAEAGSDDIAAKSSEIYDSGDNPVGTGTTTLTDGTKPAVDSMTGPSDGTYGVGENLSFEITYDEAVIVNTTGGTPSVDLTVNGTKRSADFVSGNNSKTLTFNYTVQSADGEGTVGYDSTSVQLDGGELNDSTDNAATRDFSGSKADLSNVEADGTAPADPSSTGGGTIAADNDTSYAVDVTFPAKPESGTVTVELTDGSGNTVTETASADTTSTTTTVSGIDASALADGTDNVDISANITDDGGNENSAGLTATSTVSKDTARPVDPSSTTGGNITASNASSYDVDVAFPSKPEAGTVTVDLTDGSGTTVTASASADTTSTTTTVSGIDASALADGTDNVDISANVTDDAGNENSAGLTATTTVTKDTARPADPSSATGGNITAGNATSYDVDVSFPSKPEAGTLTLNLSDGTTTVEKSVSVDTESTTTTVSGIDASSLADGTENVDIAAKLVDQAGNNNTAGGSFTTLGTTSKDTARPADPSGATGGNVTADNATSYDVDVSFPSTPEAGTVTVDLSDGSGNSVTATASANTSGTVTTVSGIDASGLADGADNVDIAAKLVDQAGNNNTAGGTLTDLGSTSKDTDRPADPSSATGGNVTYSNDTAYDVDVTFPAAPESGTVTVRLTGDDGSTATATAAADTTSATTTVAGIDASALADGTDSVRIEAKLVDETGNGNPGGYVDLGNTTKDTARPTVSAFTVTNPSGQDVNVSVETDERLTTLTVDVTGAERANLTLANFTESGNGPYTYNATYAGSSDGDYTATLVTAADASGNNGSAGESGTVPVSTSSPDTTPPTVSGYSVTNPDGRDVVVTFDSDEALSTVTAEVSGPETATLTSFTETVVDGGYQYEGTYTASSDGDYTVELTEATDAAGNDGAAGHSGSATVDGPTVSAGSFSLVSTDDGLAVSFVADQQLSTVSVSVDGPETATLGSFTETASGGDYIYTATMETETAGNYTATLDTAAAGGLDGAAGQSDTAEIGQTSFSLAPSATSYLVGVGSNVTLSAGGDAQGVTPTYEWDTDGDTEAEATGETVSVSFDDPGQYTVDVTATADDRQLTDSVIVDVEDRTAPVARLGSVPATVSEGDTVQFNASGSTDAVGIERYAWDFDGDGRTDATGPTATYTYDRPGEFAPAVTVVDAAGNTDTASQRLSVSGPEAGVGTDRLDYGTVATGSIVTERVTVRNGGTAPLAVNATVTNGTGFEAGVETVVVEPGAAVRIPVSYTPATAGNATGALALSTNDSETGTASVALDGTAVASTLTVAGDQHDAGAVPVNDTGTVSVTLRNDGDRPVAIESLALRGNDSDQFGVRAENDLPGTVAAGGTVTVEVAYGPTAAGQHAATLAVSGNATGDGSPVLVGLTGTGTGPAATVPASTVTFGSVGQQLTAQATIDVVNEGTRPLAVDGATITGRNATAFTVVETPATVQPGETAPIAVSFTPAASGPHAAELRLATNTTTPTAPNVTVRGRGAAASIAVDRRSLNFGNVTLGETVTLNVTVENLASSETDLLVRDTLLVGENPESFAVVDGQPPFSLPPGEREQIEVAFTPRSAGAKQGQLQLLSNGATPQITVWLSNERTYIVVQEVEERNDTINVDAHNINTSKPLDVNVSQPTAREETATFDRLGMAVENRSSFDINITYGDEPPSPGAQSYQPAADNKTLEYVQLNHTVDADATYENTTVTYRVDKGSLPPGTDPDAVKLHRWGGDDWSFSATGTLVQETSSHYVYRVETPGFSQFVITGPAENVTAANQSTPTPDGDSEPTPTAASGSTSTVGETEGGTPTPTPMNQMATDGGDSGGLWLPLLGLFAAVVFLLVLLLWRRRDDEEEETDEAADGTGADTGAAATGEPNGEQP